jgi:hypothetical protein
MTSIRTISICFIVAALSACGTSKYPVTFDSQPRGAKLTCQGRDMGYTPKTLYFDSKVKEDGQVYTACVARWGSGTSEGYGRINIQPFPNGVRKTVSRSSSDGYAADAEYGRKMQLIEAQQKQAAYEETMQLLNSLSKSNSSINTYNNSYSTNSGRSLGTPVYDDSECKGSVVNNRCLGTVIPSPGNQQRCYGAVVNGECKGYLGR